MPTAWPPVDAPPANELGLPSPGVVLSRVRFAAVAAIIFLPLALFFAYGRLLRSGLPVSRLFNPGSLGLVVGAVLVLAVVLGPRTGRPTVIAGTDWVAGRGLLGRRWQVVSLGQADRFSVRVVRTRYSTKTVLTVADSSNSRVSFSFPPDDPALEELVGELRAVGAAEVDRSSLRSANGWQTTGAVTLLLALSVLPIVFLEVGPLRLLPKPIAGAFTWSGCRAALAAESDHPIGNVPFVTNPVVADGADWRLQGEQQLDAAQVAQQTENPADRLANLQRDGLTTAWQSFLQGPDGAVVAFVTLQFETSQGATAYDHYVNRAVCEHEYGRHGPRATEVRMFRGRTAGARWVAGSTVVEIVQTPSQPFPTRQEIDAVAHAFGG